MTKARCFKVKFSNIPSEEVNSTFNSINATVIRSNHNLAYIECKGNTSIQSINSAVREANRHCWFSVQSMTPRQMQSIKGVETC